MIFTMSTMLVLHASMHKVLARLMGTLLVLQVACLVINQDEKFKFRTISPEGDTSACTKLIPKSITNVNMMMVLQEKVSLGKKRFHWDSLSRKNDSKFHNNPARYFNLD